MSETTLATGTGFDVSTEGNGAVRFEPNKNGGNVFDADDVEAMQDFLDTGSREYLKGGDYYIDMKGGVGSDFDAAIYKTSCDNHRCSITAESIEAAADYLGVNVEEFEQSTRDKVVRSLAREGVPKAKEVAQFIGADTATFTVNDEEAARLENIGFAVATREVDGNTLYVLLCDEEERLNVNGYERSRADDVAHVAAESGAAFDVSLLD